MCRARLRLEGAGELTEERRRSQRVPHPQLGVPPEQVDTGQAKPEDPRCRHVWTVRAEQRWLWRVSVTCEYCGYHLPFPGRWWWERDVRKVVDETLRRMRLEGEAWGERP